jgi:exosome complex component RRP42
MAVSASEARYIIESCLTDFRIDGRTQLEHRPYTITNRSSKSKTNIGNAPSLILSNGSSRIHLPGSSTDVLCSVKADLVHPSPMKPNEGVLELAVDLSLCGGGGAVGGVAGGGGGGAPKRRRQQREEESQIASLLQRLVLPHAVDYRKLVVWPGRYVWRLAVDLVVLRCDGCVLDAASLALREALGNTRLPRVQVCDDYDKYYFYLTLHYFFSALCRWPMPCAWRPCRRRVASRR